MSALILDGKSLSLKIREELAETVSALKASEGQAPQLATILVGDYPPSKKYVAMKKKACQKIGIDFLEIALPATTTESFLLEKISDLNQDSRISGILIQHPLPLTINERHCFEAVTPVKDVDGVGALGLGHTALGLPTLRSATAGGIMRLLEYYEIELQGKRAVVIGRGPVVGLPLSMMLMRANATVTICHSKTTELPKILSEADIVVAALGVSQFVKTQWLRKGSVVVDAGYNEGGKGDTETALLPQKCSAYTPVPGGVGPMTIATLLSQVVKAFCQQRGL